jgi:hypothetical protein
MGARSEDAFKSAGRLISDPNDINHYPREQNFAESRQNP